MAKWLFLTLFTVLFSAADAQYSRYIIRFKNKGLTPYSLSNPQQFLSTRAIERRIRYNLNYDSTDLPVTPQYVESVRLAGAVTILNVSKWLNAVTIQTSDAGALAKINALPFVQSAAPVARKVDTSLGKHSKSKIVSIEKTNDVSTATELLADYFSYGASYGQVHIHNGEFLHNIGLRGQNIIIGMLDGGFYNYTGLKAFDSARANGQILGTWDFVAKESSVVEDDAHGMYCFSIIAANIPNQFVGTAPKALFYLFRTEDGASEFPIEEFNWVAGAERVDSVGGDLISSSLGYTTFDSAALNHSYADMNGNTAMSTIGADLAAKKGILVVAAAGNDGANSWHYISAPADGDSVLAVGAVGVSGQVGSFSSFGPSSDGQIKPDVASVGVGTTIQSTSNTVTSGNGTSFACPNMAGLAACLWQGFQEFNNMKIIDALRKSGSIAIAPNDRIGFGIPDVKKATMLLLKDVAKTTATVSNCKTTLNWTSKDVATMKYEIERKVAGETNFIKIGDRLGTGSTFALNSYQFTDSLTNAPAGVISYRIRQIIDTAAATFFADYIDTASVDLASSCINSGNSFANNFLVMPNPAHESFVLKITTAPAIPNLVIRIVAGDGRTVAIVKRSKQVGFASFDVPIMHLPKGKYYVSVFDNEKLIVTKELLKL